MIDISTVVLVYFKVDENKRIIVRVLIYAGPTTTTKFNGVYYGCVKYGNFIHDEISWNRGLNTECQVILARAENTYRLLNRTFAGMECIY